MVATYDEEDAKEIESRVWHYNQAGYAYCWEPYKEALTMHRLVCPTDMPIIHHVDNDGLNNTRANLQPMTFQHHSQLMRKRQHGAMTSSQYKGVHWEDARQRWKATITVGGKLIFLGRFDTEDEAYAARLGAERMYFGKDED